MNPALPWHEQIDRAEPDLLRSMLKMFVQSIIAAETDAICGAGYGERSAERVNSRNGYWPREWDTRGGTMELAIPKLRSGSYFPDWLLERRKRAERALPTGWRPAICWGSRPAGWRSSSRPSGSPG